MSSRGAAPLLIRRPVGRVLRRLLACRRAQDTVEYVLLALLIALATTDRDHDLR